VSRPPLAAHANGRDSVGLWRAGQGTSIIGAWPCGRESGYRIEWTRHCEGFERALSDGFALKRRTESAYALQIHSTDCR